MKKGFSLTEILVSIAIIGILSGIGVETFYTSRQRARLEEDVAKVVQALRKAQNSALAPSRSETVGLISTAKLCAIGVNIDAGSKTIQSIYKTVDVLDPDKCDSNNNPYGTDTTVNYVTTDMVVIFDIPFAERLSSDSSVILSLDGVTKTITVTDSGLIKVE